MCRRSVVLTAIAILCSAMLSAHASLRALAADIVLSADPCFQQMQPGGATYPIKITAENPGASADGIIEVYENDYAQSQRVYDYPIDLPSGTVKQLIAYPHLAAYAGTVDVDFKGNGRAKPIAMTVDLPGASYFDEKTGIGLIGDDVGGLAAARVNVSAGSQPPDYDASTDYGPLSFTDSYCKPEDAPDRAIGYSGLKLLVLGAGAERLNPDQWSAIREWVVGGGDLLFLGGAGSLAALQSSDAAALCPMQSLHETSDPSLTLPLRGNSTGATLRNVALVTGNVPPGTSIVYLQNDLPILSRRAYGIGMVSLAAFNPFDEPAKSSPQSAGILQDLLLVGRDGIHDAADAGNTFQSGGASGTASGNPFHIHLPPVGQVALIFGVYFILVVPVTYLLLRRRGRLEWAWATTPILSVIFAFVLYLYSAELYKAGLSRRTAGAITVAEGIPDAHFRGYSELFIPRGGSYDISIPGAEALEQVDMLGGGGYGYPASAVRGGGAFTTTDTIDGVEALGYGVGNLAFRRLYYAQPIRLTGTIDGHVAGQGRALLGQITNNSPFPLTGVTVYAPVEGVIGFIGSLACGQTKSIRTKPGGDWASSGQATGDMYVLKDKDVAAELPGGLKAASDRSAFIVGHTSGKFFGPSIGQDVSGETSVVYIESIPLESTAAGGVK